jgi:hypothetical protein
MSPTSTSFEVGAEEISFRLLLDPTLNLPRSIKLEARWKENACQQSICATWRFGCTPMQGLKVAIEHCFSSLHAVGFPDSKISDLVFRRFAKYIRSLMPDGFLSRNLLDTTSTL